MTFCVEGWAAADCECEPTPDPEHIAAAQYILYGLTGKQFGTCEVTVRPCVYGRCSPQRRCCGGWDIALPGPVDSILEVSIDGEPVDPETYRVDNRRYLVSEDGPWPSCQNFSDTVAGFEVTYLQGTPVPTGAGTMVAELACEIAKAACNDASCRLPKRIVSKSRQGVTVAYDDFVNDITGIYMVDAWVAQAKAPTLRPRVLSPELTQVREETWRASPPLP